MARWLKILLGVALGALPLRAEVEVFTNRGDLFRTSDGVQWQWVANMGLSDGVAYTVGPGGTRYLLSRSGIVLRSQDQGATWTRVAAYPTSDAVAFLYDSANGYTFLLSASGDLYRGSQPQSLQLVANLGGSDFVDLARERRSSGSADLVVIGRHGDVYRSADHGSSWQRVGSVGASDVVALAAETDTLVALTHTGDLWRSVDRGASWLLWSTVSQVGAVDLLADRQGYLFVITETGALARFLSGTWQWVGTASQVFVQGMAAMGTPTLTEEGTGEEPSQVRLFPNPSHGLFYLAGVADSLPHTFEVVDVAGRRVFQGALSPQSPALLDLRALPPGVYWVVWGPWRFRAVKH